jgi:hypothetical protein
VSTNHVQAICGYDKASLHCLSCYLRPITPVTEIHSHALLCVDALNVWSRCGIKFTQKRGCGKGSGQALKEAGINCWEELRVAFL